MIRAYQMLSKKFGLHTYTDEYVRKNCFILPPPTAFENLGIVEKQREALELLNQYVYRENNRFFPGVLAMLRSLHE